MVCEGRVELAGIRNDRAIAQLSSGSTQEFLVTRSKTKMTPNSAQAKSPHPTPIRKRHNSIEAFDFVVFVIPCLQLIRIRVIGVLNGSDLLMLVIFLSLALRGKLRVTSRVGKWSLILCSLWLASQCVTDIVRHSALADYARGWSNIGLTFISLAVLWTLLYGRPHRLTLYGWGLVIGGVLYAFINPNEMTAAGAPGDLWKFGLAFPLSLGAFLLASRKECRGHWPITLAVLMGMINMVLGARAVGGICLAAALYLSVTSLSRRKNPEIFRLKTRTMVALAASIIIGGAAVMWAYQYTANAGILGERAKEKYDEESSGEYGVLLGGRTEVLATFPAIYDSPILGHGSWAKEPLYIILQNQALARLGYKVAWNISNEQLQEGLIPTHSYLFGAWVDGGILGAVFWVWVFAMTARVLTRVHPATAVLLPVVSFLSFFLLWDILFSPYGTPGRISFPYSIVVLMTLMDAAASKMVRAMPARPPKRIKASLKLRPQG